MAASETLLLFGDQAGDITSATRELFRRSKHSLNLQSFIQQSQGVVHEEYRKYRGQDAVPTELLAIRSFLELASKESAVLHPATRTLLFTFVQIGELIHLAENGIIYPSSSPKVLASCTGLLSAVVALTSQSVPDILNCSKATITLALRLGLAAAQRSASIQQCASQEAWAVAIAGVASEQCLEAVKEFNEDNVGSNLRYGSSYYRPILIQIADTACLQVGIYQCDYLGCFNHRLGTSIDIDSLVRAETGISCR